MAVALVKARRVVTMAGDDAQALAVEDGRVVDTGAADALRGRFPGADVTDLGDAVVVPGFNDAHEHITMVAEDLLHLDMSPSSISSIADLQRAVRERAAEPPPGAWVRGSRYDQTKTSDGRTVDRADLDTASPRTPVVVVQVAGHWCIANSAALAAAGIDESTEALPGGEFGRDAAGRLNGIVYERAMGQLFTAMPSTSPADLLEGLRRAQEMFHAAGITSVTDAFASAGGIAFLDDAQRRGLLTMRVNALLGYHSLDAIGSLPPDGPRLRVAGVKTLIDGAIAGRTCLVDEPFEGTHDHGMQTLPTDVLRDVVRRTHARGVPCAIHANGDRGIRMALDAFEDAHAATPRPGIRHRIEHCTIVDDEILSRLQRLGAVAVPFGSYVSYHGDKLLEWYGARRLERMFAHRSFLDRGIPVAGSSDYPCGPFEPLLALQSCVTRRSDSGDVLGAAQRISPAEALALYTTGSAYSTGEEQVKGRLAPGYYADFVALAEDPLTRDPSRLSSIQVLGTYVGGTRVWPA